MPRILASIVLLVLGIFAATFRVKGDQLVPPDTVSVWQLHARLAQVEAWHPSSTVTGSVDLAQVIYDTNVGGYVLQVFGWAASCQAGSAGIPQGIDIAVDPETTLPNMARWYSEIDFPNGGHTNPAFIFARQDVQNWAAAVGWTGCVSPTPGFWLWIDASTIAPGSHTVWMRLWDTTNGTARTIGYRAFER
jgi:hypothetical protein